jgi:hypothetical protein
MTTVTDRTYRVPVPTELAKTVLGVVFGCRLTGLLEAAGAESSSAWRVEDHLADGTDAVIDGYVAGTEELRHVEAVFLSLRKLTPGKDATIEVREDDVLVEALGKEIAAIADMGEDVDPPMQRRVAEATIAAIDLRELVEAAQDEQLGGDV